jgi:hypothetical protein
MDKIEKEIEQLINLKHFLKLQLNCNYGNTIQSNFQILFDKRNEVTKEIRKLQLIKNRLEKISQIKSKI